MSFYVSRLVMINSTQTDMDNIDSMKMASKLHPIFPNNFPYALAYSAALCNLSRIFWDTLRIRNSWLVEMTNWLNKLTSSPGELAFKYAAMLSQLKVLTI